MSQAADCCSKDLWNIGEFLWDYMMQHPRRCSSSYSLPWEYVILTCIFFASNVCASFLH
jgi:hypothetical protein